MRNFFVGADDGVGEDGGVRADARAFFPEGGAKGGIVPQIGDAAAQMPARRKADGGDMGGIDGERFRLFPQIQHRHARLQDLGGIGDGGDVVFQHEAVEPRRIIAQGDGLPFPLRPKGVGAAGDDEHGGADTPLAQFRKLRVAVGKKASLPFPFAADAEISV